MASQGADGRCWRDLFLPILDAESGVYRAGVLYSRLSEQMTQGHGGGVALSILLVEGQPSFGRRLKPAGIRAVARTLASTARQEDVPARLGPRSFAMLLPGLQEPVAARIGLALELDLRLSTAGTGDRWRVSCLSYPAQREHLERLALRGKAAYQSREMHARRRP